MSAKSEEKDEKIKSYWFPDRTAELEYVKFGYSKWYFDYRLLYLAMIPVFAGFFFAAVQRPEFMEISNTVYMLAQQSSKTEEFWVMLSAVVVSLIVLVAIVTVYFLKKSRDVYLLQFTTYQPPDDLKVPYSRFNSHSKYSGYFDEDSLQFQDKLLSRTGLGEETYFPPGILSEPPLTNMAMARKEAEMVFTGCLDALFSSTGFGPKDIDILIVNCSLFNPTPSLSEMIINKYKMRSDVRNYNLAGMGCSAGVISIDLARDLLQVHKESLALVVSTENITQNWYKGNQKSMLISNTLFRLGGAAILLSNKRVHSSKAKYLLNHVIRVHKGANDAAYKAVYQDEDEKGCRGVSISKDLMNIAGDALKTNLTILGPLVLPWSEQVKFFVNLMWKKYEIYTKSAKRTPSYVPDFKKAFQHFCIHAGGRAIIDGLEENLKLEPHHVEPSRATLYRYGNTSSSSIWYELQYIEWSGSIKQGEKVFQIALGSGFQCNSAVWQRLRK